MQLAPNDRRREDVQAGALERVAGQVRRVLFLLEPFQHLVRAFRAEFLILLHFSNVLLHVCHLQRAFFLAHHREARGLERTKSTCLDFRAPKNEDLVLLEVRMVDDEVLLGEVDQVAPARAGFGAEVDRVGERRVLLVQQRSAGHRRQLLHRGQLRLADRRGRRETRERLDEHVERRVLRHADGVGHRAEVLGVTQLGRRLAVRALLEDEEADADLQRQLRPASRRRQELVEMIEEIGSMIPCRIGEHRRERRSNDAEIGIRHNRSKRTVKKQTATDLKSCSRVVVVVVVVCCVRRWSCNGDGRFSIG